MYPLDDTIVAVSSPRGGAARGIVRLSGPLVVELLGKCFTPQPPLDLAAITQPTAIPGEFHLGGDFAPLPCELFLWPGQRSYTGGPVAEVHTLGSPPLLDAAVETLCRAGARLAQPGEFTLRAFMAGRIDLTQAEAVLGVIDAGDSTELDVALAQLAGGLARPLAELRDSLVELLTHIEAGLDFADEDIEFISPQQIQEQLTAANENVLSLVRQMQSRSDLVDRARVVLSGRPNTGKSSLFNALATDADALVSHEPGTTRDYLTAQFELDGIKCRLIDTAGVDDPADLAAPDREAQETANRQTKQSHVRILCIDSTRPLDDWERRQLSSAEQPGRIVVLTKIDLVRATDFDQAAIETSSLSGQGIDELEGRLRDAVLSATARGSSAVGSTALRCGESLRLAAESLARAITIAESQVGEELISAELRVALVELGTVAGAVYTDDLLDQIFSRFCVGK
jgi:tRNA modification GTPase